MKNINFAEPYLGSLEVKNCNIALKSGWLSKGKYVGLFEKKFSKVIGSKFSVSVNNGTNSFLLILMHLKINPGDEIIVPSFCYISPIHIIKLIGAIPIVADVDLNTFQIDSEKIIKKISKKTKAILVVHSYGGIADIVSIKNIADKFKITILEDFSESIFTKFDKKYIGSGSWEGKNFDLISFCSLHATKTITSGEGGVITTNSLNIYKNLCNLRDHGVSNKKAYFYKQLGSNFRLSNILASIAFSQIIKYKYIISKKKEIFFQYIKLFKNLDSVAVQKFIPQSFPILWGFSLRVKQNNGATKIIKELNKKTVIVRPGFCSSHKLKYLKFLKNNKNSIEDFKNSSILEKNIIVLPMHVNINNQQIKFIFNKIKSALK